MIKEKHGRFIADIYSCVDGTCINDWLRDSNLCVEYTGGKKEKINWCDIIGSENFYVIYSENEKLIQIFLLYLYQPKTI